MEETSTVLVPLRSNAKGLVAGAGVAAVRRRLKTASLLYDQVLLEGGTVRIHAGPTGAQAWFSPMDPSAPRTTWDSSRARASAKGRRFSVSVAPEPQAGTPATGPFRTILNSDTTIAWDTSLEPFANELPGSCDWIEYVAVPSLPPAYDRLAREWRGRDDRNGLLAKAVPVGFVRSRVIEHANHDLACAAANDLAVSADKLHQTVMESRLKDEIGWQFHGYAIPLLIPGAEDLSWEQLVTLRGNRHLNYFRSALREIENEALVEAGADLERTVHRLYEGKLRSAVQRTEGAGSVVLRSAIGFVVGIASGFATAGITGPIGPFLGAASGTTVGGILDFRDHWAKRGTRGWVSMDVRVRAAVAARPS